MEIGYLKGCCNIAVLMSVDDSLQYNKYMQ